MFGCNGMYPDTAGRKSLINPRFPRGKSGSAASQCARLCQIFMMAMMAAGRRAVRDRDIGSHLAVAQLDLDGLRFHADRLHAHAWAAVRAGSFSSAHAFPANIFSRSAEEMGSASIASIVLAIRPRPCSASNGASVANRHDDVP